MLHRLVGHHFNHTTTKQQMPRCSPNEDHLNMKRVTHTQSIPLTALILLTALAGTAAEAIIVESRKVDGTPNTPAWAEVSGKWNTSKNKSRVASWSSLVATNISICTTNVPVPAFKVTPTGLATNTSYKVEVTFSTTSTHVAAPDLEVAITTEGVAASTIPAKTKALQGTGADTWVTLGEITPATSFPSLTFTYVSGTLTKESRWYADAMRFTPVPPKP
jgi:hypothetical protein